MISLNQINYAVADRILLDRVTCQIYQRQHLALIGRNGSGKSTLFKIIQGQLAVDHGQVEVAKSWQILAVNQELPEGHLSPMEHLLAQDVERHALLQQLEACLDPLRMAAIYDQLIQIDAYSAESRAATILKGLGFDEAAQRRPLKSFSGGFRMRVALAAVLFQQPDLLLLDEPTNHLDLRSTAWLQKFLQGYPKSFLLISHERDFLNATAEQILHLKNGQLNSYTGNFDAFLIQAALRQEQILAHNSKLKSQRDHMIEFVQRNRAKASKAKQAQSRLKAIEKLQFIPVEPHDPTIQWKFPEPQGISPPLLSFSKITLGYGECTVLRNLSATILPEDRIAIVGDNGEGKTTLARFLAGELAPQNGKLQSHKNLKLAFYKQDQAEELSAEESVYGYISRLLVGTNDRQIRSHLGNFGFSGVRVEQRVGELSGGERARLLFAGLAATAPQLLILDEPTNHLDMEMREALIKSLNHYQGAVLLISHDRHLLRHVADSLWVVEQGTLAKFSGGLTDYERSANKRV